TGGPKVAASADAKTVDEFVAPYVTADHVAVVVVEPQRIIDAPLLSVFPQEMRNERLDDLMVETRFDPRKIERVAVLIPVPPEGMFGEVPSGPPIEGSTVEPPGEGPVPFDPTIPAPVPDDASPATPTPNETDAPAPAV